MVVVRLWPPKKYLSTNTPPQNSKVSAIKPAAGSHRTQGGMGVEPTVKVSLAPIASSAARTIKTAPPRYPAAGVPLIF